jgi:hypothetical protein
MTVQANPNGETRQSVHAIAAGARQKASVAPC